MRRTLLMPVLIVGVLCVALLMGGCERQDAEQTAMPPPDDDGAVRTASDLAVELTYPQSDDQGNYVSIDEPGEVIVEGVASGPDPVETIQVNGATVHPYEVEHITPYGEPVEHPIYRFRAPVVVQPDDEIVVVASGPYDGVDYIFVPDTDATVERWTTLADEDPALESRLGSAYYASHAYEDAASHLTRAAERDESPWSLYDLGMTYLAMDRPDDALETFDRAEPMYADMPDLYYGRGLTYNSMDRFDDAIANFVRSSDLAPDWAEPLVALGMTHYSQGLLADSADDYQRAIALQPEWPAPYYGLAQVRLDQDRPDDALPLIHEAEQRGPWRARHHEELARKLHEKGNYVAARRQLEIADRLGGERDDWWGDVERETPDYRESDRWPWEPRVEDDGYRVPDEHPWYSEDRPMRERPGREGPPAGVERGGPEGRDGPPAGVQRGGPPEGHGPDGMPGRGGPERGGPPEGMGGGQGQGGPPAGAGGGQDQGGPPAGAGGGGQGQGGPPPGRGR